jgi:tetratricopeptide (TPR) repeat protein
LNVNIYQWWGDIAGLLGRYDDALKYYATALVEADLPGQNPLNRIYTLRRQAELFIKLGRLDEIEAYLQEIEHLPEEIWETNRSFYILVRKLRGQWYCAKGYPEQAEAEYYNVLGKSLEIKGDNLESLSGLMVTLAEAWNQRGYFYKAALAGHLIYNTPTFMWWELRQDALRVLEAARPHLSHDEWAQIESEVAAITLEEYAKSLVQDTIL